MAFFAVFLHSYYLMILFVLIVILPVTAEIWFLIMYKKIEFKLSFSGSNLHKGDKTNLIIKIKSMCLIGKFDFNLLLGNNFFDKISTNVSLSVPVFKTKVKTVNLTLEEIGLYNAHIDSIIIKDIFGIFTKKIYLDKSLSTVVMPDIKETGRFDYGLVQLDNIYSSDYYNSSSGDISGVKEYVKGDRLNSVHWKASAKTDDLYVRTYENIVSEDYIILFDFNINYMKSSFDYLYTIGNKLSDSGKSYYIMWLSRGCSSLNERYISNKEELDKTIIKMYNDNPIYNDNETIDLFRKQYGNTNAIYISQDWKLI